MMHNTASYAAKALAQVTGFIVGDFLVDVFHYFDNSTKGQAMLKEFCIFSDQEYCKIQVWCYSLAQQGSLKYGATCWLSKEVCITRVLKQYPSLKSYFTSQDDLKSDPRLIRLKKYFSLPMTEINLLFYQSVMPLFTDLNKLLQNEEPKLHVLRKEMYMFLKKILGRSIQVHVYGDKDLATIDVEIRTTGFPSHKVNDWI